MSGILSIPYDSAIENLYLAYIVGSTAFGLIPRATLEIPTGRLRLGRILKLIEECAYSIHDLSRVQLDRTAPRVPRFNMPPLYRTGRGRRDRAVEENQSP